MAPYEGIGSGGGGRPSRNESLPEGVITDQKVLAWIYKEEGADVHAIATDRFLNKSKSQYNPPWLVREIVQNFVDHNVRSPGTLDGVKCKKTMLTDGRTRFEIIGDWPYTDPTGALSPHSEKPAGTETAGGNGIGLKQTAIRFLRDFEVDTFELYGEKWSLAYRLARADETNARIRRRLESRNQEPAVSVKHDWLVGELKETKDTGRCRYVIETRNPAMIRALDTFAEIGVGKENPYLTNPDFQNQYGSITWIRPGEAPKTKKRRSKKAEPQKDDDGSGVMRGRLFVNGQTMNWGRQGPSDEKYWVGPEFMTIRLNNLKYDMTVDRPPVSQYELPRYLSRLIDSMDRATALDQLKRAEPIWSTQDHYGAWLTVTKEIIDRLVRLGCGPEEFAKAFPGKKYLAYDAMLNTKQEEDLENDGYILCPAHFSAIGMPRASVLLSQAEQARHKNKPDTYDVLNGMEKLAAETGIQAVAPEYKCVSTYDFAAVVKEHLLGRASAMSFDDTAMTIKLSFPLACPKELMYDAFANGSGGKGEELMYVLRGCIRAGLDSTVLQNGYVTNPDYTAIFSTRGYGLGGKLFMKIIKQPNDGMWSAELAIKESSYAIVKSLLSGETPAGVPEEPPPFERYLEPEARAAEGPRVPRPAPELPSRAWEPKAPIRDTTLQIPGVKEAVASLEGVVAEKRKSRGIGGNIVDQYNRLVKGEKRSAATAAGYLTGRHLLEILNESSEAAIAPGEDGSSELSRRLQALANRSADADERVENMDIVLEPSEAQLEQLTLLRRYLNLTTGGEFGNDLFVFRGDGAKGVNIGQRAIGLHEEVLKVSFMEASNVMVHELAHNLFMNHSVEFIATMQALFARSEQTIYELSEKIGARKTLTKDERFILETRRQWDRLRSR